MTTLRYASKLLLKNPGFTLAAVVVPALAFTLGANTAFPQADASVENSRGGIDSAAARWEGTVQLPGTELKMVIDLAQDIKGNWEGSAIAPGFGVKGAPLADVAVRGSDVSFTVKGALGDPKFKGHLTSDGTLTGDYLQAGNTAPLVLRKAGPPQVEPQRQSTAVSKEFEGEWQGDLEVMGKKPLAHVTLTNQSGGPATAQFETTGDIPIKLPVDLVTQEGDSLTLESPGSGFTYQGRIFKDANEIRGDFQLGPFESPLNLHRAPKSATKPQS
jgi:hypothetical protein